EYPAILDIATFLSLNKLFGFIHRERRRSAGGRCEETTMGYSTIGCLVTLTLSMLVAPLLAVAQPVGKVPTIGFLNPSSAAATARNFAAFTQCLRALGYIEGQTIAIAQRYAEGNPERLPALAAELAALPVDVFVVNVNRTAEAVQQTTTQVPI